MIKQQNPLSQVTYGDLRSAIKSTRQQLLNERLGKEMWRNFKTGVGLAGLGTGAYQLLKLVSGTAAARKATPRPLASTIQLYDPQENEKRAFDFLDNAANSIGTMVNDAVSGQGASTTSELPYGLPARGLALAGGIGLTSGALLAAAKHLRRRSMESELRRTEREYEQALRSLASTPPQAKTAAAKIDLEADSLPEGALGEQLNRLYDEASRLGILDKTAGASGELGRALGVYALYALLSGGAGAYFGYKNRASKRDVNYLLPAYHDRMQRKKQDNPHRPVAVVGAA